MNKNQHYIRILCLEISCPRVQIEGLHFPSHTATSLKLCGIFCSFTQHDEQIYQHNSKLVAYTKRCPIFCLTSSPWWLVTLFILATAFQRCPNFVIMHVTATGLFRCKPAPHAEITQKKNSYFLRV